MKYIITIAFIVMDYLSGAAQSVYNNTFKSSIMRQGIFHKLALITVLILAALFDWSAAYIDLGVLSTVPISGLVCTGFIIMEIGSVLENLHKINSDIPDSFSGLLHIGAIGDAPCQEDEDDEDQ